MTYYAKILEFMVSTHSEKYSNLTFITLCKIPRECRSH